MCFRSNKARVFFCNVLIIITIIIWEISTEEEDEIVVEVDEVAMTEDAQLCTEQLVLIVVMVVRFLSDQVETNLFIAVVVLKKEMIQVQENLLNLTRAVTI